MHHQTRLAECEYEKVLNQFLKQFCFIKFLYEKTFARLIKRHLLDFNSAEGPPYYVLLSFLDLSDRFSIFVRPFESSFHESESRSGIGEMTSTAIEKRAVYCRDIVLFSLSSIDQNNHWSYACSYIVMSRFKTCYIIAGTFPFENSFPKQSSFQILAILEIPEGGGGVCLIDCLTGLLSLMKK